MNNELMPVNPALPGHGADPDLISAQMKLWAFLGKRVERYTMGESSSVRAEIAEELLQSVCFTLGIPPDAPQAFQNLADWDLDERFAAGTAEIEEKIKINRQLWRAACLSVPKIENISLRDTLSSLGKFPGRYDYRFFAHDIPCDIDYQLCRPVPDVLLGVDYVNEYLRRLIAENDLLRRFDERQCIRLLERYCPDYKGLLINLYEPVATNAVGLALCGGAIAALGISDAQRGRIASVLAPLSGEAAVERLKAAASSVSAALSIRQPRARLYLRELAANLWPRIDAALDIGGLEGIFLSL